MSAPTPEARVVALRDLERGLSAVKNCIGRLNPAGMAEDDSQQAQSAWDQVTIFMPRALAVLRAEIAAKDARLAEVEAALRPFGLSPVLDVLFDGVPDNYAVTVNMKAADYRRAHAALQAAPAAGQDGEVG